MRYAPRTRLLMTEEGEKRWLTGMQHEHSVATINVHSSYTNQLAAERNINAQLRQKEIENEGRLTNISTMLRQAYQVQTEMGDECRIEKLERENAVLREALGLGEEPKGPEELENL